MTETFTSVMHLSKKEPFQKLTATLDTIMSSLGTDVMQGTEDQDPGLLCINKVWRALPLALFFPNVDHGSNQSISMMRPPEHHVHWEYHSVLGPCDLQSH